MRTKNSLFILWIFIFTLNCYAGPVTVKRGSKDGIHYDYIKWTYTSTVDVLYCIDPGSSVCVRGGAITMGNGELLDISSVESAVLQEIVLNRSSGVMAYGDFWVKWQSIPNSEGFYDYEFHVCDTYEEMVSSPWQLNL